MLKKVIVRCDKQNYTFIVKDCEEIERIPFKKGTKIIRIEEIES